MANFSTINQPRFVLALQQEMANGIGAEAFLSSGVIEQVRVDKITSDTLTELVVSVGGSPEILTRRAAEVNAMTLSEGTNTVSVGSIPLKFEITYAQIAEIEAAAAQTMASAENSIGGLESLIAQKWVGQVIPVLLTKWGLTLMKARVEADSSAMLVDITGEDAPANQITASTATNVVGRLYEAFGEDVGKGEYVGLVGCSTAAADFHKIRNSLDNKPVYPRQAGRVMVDGLPIIQSDIADSEPASGLLTNVYGTRESATMANDTVLRTYLVKRNALRAFMSDSLAAIDRNLRIIETSGVGSSSTAQPGLSFFLRMEVAMAAPAKIPYGTKPGVAGLYHNRLAVG